MAKSNQLFGDKKESKETKSQGTSTDKKVNCDLWFDPEYQRFDPDHKEFSPCSDVNDSLCVLNIHVNAYVSQKNILSAVMDEINRNKKQLYLLVASIDKMNEKRLKFLLSNMVLSKVVPSVEIWINDPENKFKLSGGCIKAIESLLNQINPKLIVNKESIKTIKSDSETLEKDNENAMSILNTPPLPRPTSPGSSSDSDI